MIGLKNVWKTMRWGVRVLVLLGVVSLGLNIYSWIKPPDMATMYRYIAPIRPYVAPQAREISNVDSTPVCVETIEYKPTEKQKKEIEKKIGGDLVSGRLLNLVDIKKLPYGGKGVISTPDPTEENPNPQTTLTVYPNKQPLFELGGLREFSVGVNPLDTERWDVELSQDLFRVGPAWVTGQVGYDNQTGWETKARVKVRF